MGDVIDFQKYKQDEEIAIIIAEKVIDELSGKVNEKEVAKLFKNVPTHYVSRILFALDFVLEHAALDDKSMEDTQEFSDAIADIVAQRMEDIGVKIDD